MKAEGEGGREQQNVEYRIMNNEGKREGNRGSRVAGSRGAGYLGIRKSGNGFKGVNGAILRAND